MFGWRNVRLVVSRNKTHMSLAHFAPPVGVQRAQRRSLGWRPCARGVSVALEREAVEQSSDGIEVDRPVLDGGAECRRRPPARPPGGEPDHRDDKGPVPREGDRVLVGGHVGNGVYACGCLYTGSAFIGI